MSAVLTGLACALTPAVSAGQNGAASLDYTAAEGCPEESEFRRQVVELAPAVRFGAASAEGLHLRVSLSRQGAEYLGVLEAGRRGSTPARSVRGDSCGEVVGALALAAALLIDPDALAGGSESATEEPIELEETGRQESPPPASASKRVARVESGPTRARVGASMEGFWLPVRGREDALGSAGFFLSGELLRRLVGTVASARLELGVSKELSGDAVPVALTWLPRVRGGVCTFWWSVGGGWTMAPCLGAEVGLLQSRSTQQWISLGPARRPWWAASAEVRATWLRAPSGWGLDLRLAALIPLVVQDYRVLQGEQDLLLLQIAPRPGLSCSLGYLSPWL